MKWNILFCIIGTILISYGAYASVGINPSDLNITTMHGGDTREVILTLTNNDSWDNSAHLVVVSKDSNNDPRGFDIYLSNNNLGLAAGQTQYITLTIHALTNIKPGIYNIRIFADGSGYKPDQVYNGGGSGGGSYYNPPHVDTNDNNVPVLGGDRDAYGCIPSAGYSWCAVKNRCIRSWEESCVTINDINTVIIDKNIYIDNNIDKPYIPNEWIAFYLAAGAIIAGGVIFIYFRLNKPKVIKSSTEQVEVSRNN